MKRAVLHIVLLLFVVIAVGAHRSHPAWPIIGTWQFKAPMPEARSGASAVTLGEYIYVIGGKDASGVVSNRVDRYDPVADTWEEAEPLQESRFNAASVVWNNTIVVVGGRSNGGQTLKTVEQFNPESNSWVSLQALVEAREGHSVVVLDDVMYAAGGSDAAGRIFDSVELYNPNQGAWSITGQWQLDFPRASFAMVAVNDSAFVIGGFNTFGPLSFVQRFHPGIGVASRQGIDPARGGLAAVSKGDRVFAMGGITASNQAISTTNVYLTAENRWFAEAPMNTPRAQFPAVVFGNDLYVFGGEDALGTVTGSVEVFISGVAPVAEDDSFLTDEDTPLTFNVLANDTDPGGTTLLISTISQPAGGRVTQESTDGTLTYTPNQNFNGIDRFTYTIVNEEGSIASADVIITVTSINDLPMFTSSPVLDGITGVQYEYNIEVLDADGPNISITADAVPGWLTLSDMGNGAALLSGTPAIEDVGNHLVTLRGSDGIAEQVQSFLISVSEGIPPVPVLLTPVNNADSVNVPVIFTWSELGATSWDIQIGTNNQFTNILINASNLPEAMYQEAGLDVGTTYFWRVRARNEFGISDWSSPSRFTFFPDGKCCK